MKKGIFYSVFALLVIASGIAGWYVYSRDHEPPPKSVEKETLTKERKYTQQERKQILQAMIERNQELWRERYILGGIYLQEMDFERAGEQFKKIIKIRPQMIQAYNALGMCYLNQGKNAEAVAIWEKAVEIDPENEAARDLIGRVKKTEGRAKERRKLEILLEKNPNLSQAWFDLGKIYLEEKLYDRAISAFEKASQLEPDRADYLYRLGYTYHRTRNYGKAETALKAALVLTPENENIKRLLQDVQAKLQKDLLNPPAGE
jgi:cytochrome c-type biogenesis protein CcmH/NrfG